MDIAILFSAGQQDDVAALIAHHNAAHPPIYNATVCRFKTPSLRPPGTHAVLAKQDMYSPDSYDLFQGRGYSVITEPTRNLLKRLDPTSAQPLTT